MEKYRDCAWVYVSFENKALGRNFLELLEILGVDQSRLRRIDRVTRFRKIVVPDECFWCEEDGSRSFNSAYRRLIDSVRQYGREHMAELEQKKYYFTYANAARYRQIGEKKLERFFGGGGVIGWSRPKTTPSRNS